MKPADDVRATVTRVVHHIDARRWPELRAQFADVVHTDYTSLFGGVPQDQQSDDLVAGWRNLLTPLEATQHLLGPVDVTIDGDAAAAECHVRAYHILPGLPGGGEWMVAGHYRFRLARRSAGWAVTALTLVTHYQTGNRKLLGEAAARSPSP